MSECSHITTVFATHTCRAVTSVSGVGVCGGHFPTETKTDSPKTCDKLVSEVGGVDDLTANNNNNGETPSFNRALPTAIGCPPPCVPR